MTSKWKYLLLLKLSEFYLHIASKGGGRSYSKHIISEDEGEEGEILKKGQNRTPLVSMSNQTLLYYYLDTCEPYPSNSPVVRSSLTNCNSVEYLR